MGAIASFLESDHRHCDDLLAQTELAAGKSQWRDAGALFAKFADDLARHLDREENVLFPLFEAATGMCAGPTAVMRDEHAQMRGMIAQMRPTIEARNASEFLGLSESLMMLIQQHNMKEEQVLYPAAERAIGTDIELLGELRSVR